MKKAVSDIQILKRLNQFNDTLRGVFTTADLYHIVGALNPVVNQRRITHLINEGMLTRVKRGIYVSESFDPVSLAAVVDDRGYVSMATVLAQRGLMGTVPQNFIAVVSCGKSKRFEFALDVLQIFHISEDLFFGFERTNSGANIADNEKAFLDLLYYYNLGQKFPFDPKSEILIDQLNLAKIKSYLKHYKNERFKKFVKGVINDCKQKT